MQYAKHISAHNTVHHTDTGDFVDREVETEREELHPSTVSRIQQIVYTVYGIVAGLLLLRFIFSLFGANPANGVASFVYTVTHPLVLPFQTLFGESSTVYSTSRVELGTLAAIVIYALIAWTITHLVGIDKEAARRDAEL